MLKIYLIFISFFLFIQVDAQNLFGNISDQESYGDKQFNRFSYVKAIESYERALKIENAEEDSLYIKIAESYRLLNDPENATKWYAKVIEENSQVSSKYLLNYADALSSIRDYKKAKKYYEIYSTRVSNDTRAKDKIEAINNQSAFFTNHAEVSVSLASFNSNGPDFSPTFYGNDLVFVSSRKSDRPITTTFNWDGSEYLDLFRVNPKGEISRFHKKINTKYHEGPLVFPDTTTMIFTRNNTNKGKVIRSEKGVSNLNIYTSKLDSDGQWTHAEALSFNNNEYSVGHPAITDNSSIIYFASNKPGGYGGVDLYKCQKTSEDWGEPINLGKNINTKGDELFPFISPDNILYFASDGQKGLGGLDMFGIDLNQLEASEALNLGAPLNSHLDDFGLIVDKTGKSGYFSSNRVGSKNQDDIYQFESKKPLITGYLFSGIVIDNHYSTSLSNAIVTLMDDKGKETLDTLSNERGEFRFQLEFGKSYLLSAKKLGYHLIKKLQIEDNKATNSDSIILKLEPPHHVISVKAVDMATKIVLSEAEVHVVDTIDHEFMEISKRGSYHHEFETKGGNSYKAFALLHDYFSNSIKIEIGFDHVYDTLSFEIPLEHIIIGKAIELEHIYYDLNKSKIRKDAAFELDKLVKILNENPTIEIELSSHSDSRGSDTYNMQLSQRRANSAVAYIISKGILKNRIVAKGYGETVLVNKCKNGVKCSSEEHQKNRRTEFKVTKL